MNTIKKAVLVAALIPVAFASTNALAFGGGNDKGKSDSRGKGGQCSGDIDMRAFKKLDLTDEQEDQLKALREGKRDEMRGRSSDEMQTRMAEMQAFKTKERQLVLAADFSEADAQLLAEEMVTRQSERYVQKLQGQHEMLNILTEDQKQQLQELQQERMSECSGKMQKRMNSKK
jgi:protein CpxP